MLMRRTRKRRRRQIVDADGVDNVADSDGRKDAVDPVRSGVYLGRDDDVVDDFVDDVVDDVDDFVLVGDCDWMAIPLRKFSQMEGKEEEVCCCLNG